MNTDYIECIDEIVIKNPHGCSMVNDVEMIKTRDSSFTALKSETVTIKGFFNDGTSFLLKLPINIKKQIELIVDEEDIL